MGGRALFLILHGVKKEGDSREGGSRGLEELDATCACVFRGVREGGWEG